MRLSLLRVDQCGCCPAACRLRLIGPRHTSNAARWLAPAAAEPSLQAQPAQRGLGVARLLKHPPAAARVAAVRGPARAGPAVLLLRVLEDGPVKHVVPREACGRRKAVGRALGLPLPRPLASTSVDCLALPLVSLLTCTPSPVAAWTPASQVLQPQAPDPSHSLAPQCRSSAHPRAQTGRGRACAGTRSRACRQTAATARTAGQHGGGRSGQLGHVTECMGPHVEPVPQQSLFMAAQYCSRCKLAQGPALVQHHALHQPARGHRRRTWKKTTNSVGKPLHSTSVGVAIFFSLIFSYLRQETDSGTGTMSEASHDTNACFAPDMQPQQSSSISSSQQASKPSHSK